MQKPKSIFRLMHQIKLCSLDKKGLGESLLKRPKKKRQKNVCENKLFAKHNQKKKFFLKTNVGNLIPLQYRRF